MSYIEREALKEMFSSENKPLETVICSVIDSVPSADVAPVVHGEWREDTDPADGDLRCTHCRTAWPKCVQKQIAEQGIWTLQTLFKYCPTCGCKMDGGEKHETD